MTTKQEQLEAEFRELKRVGSQPFNAYLRPELVEHDLTVFDRELIPDEVKDGNINAASAAGEDHD